MLDKYILIKDDKSVAMSEEDIENEIKQRLINNVAIKRIFNTFNVSIKRIDNLSITIENLDGKYAETNLHNMILDKSLFEDKNFFEKYMYIPAHEIVHWLSRVKEEDAYFNDPEETLGFVSSISFELSSGKSLDEIWNNIYDKVAFHFHKPLDAREFFENMLEKAYSFLSNH